jgi:hypothetical protein
VSIFEGVRRPHRVWTLSESDPPIASPPDDLWQRLSETIAWCASRAKTSAPASCLRTSVLCPRPMQPSYAAGVWDLASNRSGALTVKPAPRRDLGGGRILVYGPDEELSDGAAEAETNGYFDVYNCPPWDTWIALVEFSDGEKGRSAHLFSWVPPAFERVVQRGIAVNPEECILWLENWRTPGPSVLVDGLREAEQR